MLNPYDFDSVGRHLAPSGRLRVAINLGNPVLAQRNPHTNEPQGISVELAKRLAKQLGLVMEIIEYDAAGKVVEALDSENPADHWDLAFLARDPLRGETIGFTRPYVLIEGCYLVRKDSDINSNLDLDQPGMRVSVNKGAAYDLHLSRNLVQAEVVRAENGKTATEIFLEQGLDAAAGVRQSLTQIAADNPELKVLDENFMTIDQAMCVPKTTLCGNNCIAQEYLQDFVREQKRNGFIRRWLNSNGQHNVTVAD
ncbi:ABC transporter substrate-binding protein [Aliamphritea spongicola]|uniref:ABC transporter substrate-binding protein n=1 Tax=Aliamphritea spongicola TaxID=707589 RepID=UPI00196B48D4|nr:ABC transporter substrate-binding protein [Aliamphritea spongicola]MBN3563714.1 ABC transporter substrate-binding protein [Aliamphritea spongicola]